MERTYKIVDLFAGVGGLSYGFSINPQFEILAANEIQRDIATAPLNHPEVTMINEDIHSLTQETLEEALGQSVDWWLRSTCQSYSTLGKAANG